MASLGQIAEAAGVRPPNSSRSTRKGAQTPGAAAGIASGGATGVVPRILEPAPITGSASSSSTVGVAAPSAATAAGLAERSASATDLNQRAIRDAELGGRLQQHESDPVRPITRSTSTPPDDRSSEPVPHQQQQQQQQQDRSEVHIASAYLNPPRGSSGHAGRSAQAPAQPSRLDNNSSGQGSDPSPNSDPSPGSHASTSIIPEHHRLNPYIPSPYGAHYTPNLAGHFSASSSPVYLQQHPQSHHAHPTYAYHTQYYAPQYHYPPPSDPLQQSYYAVGHGASPHSPVQELHSPMPPQTFYPQTYYYSTGQVLHTGSSSPNSASALGPEEQPTSHHVMQDDMANGQSGRFSVQAGHQNYQTSLPQQQHGHAHAQQQQRMPANMTYQLSTPASMQPYVTYGASQLHASQITNGHNAIPTSPHMHQTLQNPPMSPVLSHTYTYPHPGSQRSSIDMGQHQYRPMHFTPTTPQGFKPANGNGGKHLRYSTIDSAFSASTPYSNADQSSGHTPYKNNNNTSRMNANGQAQQPPTELARGHLAQSKFREALGAYDPNARLPISANERNRVTATVDSRLPKPPAHSPWAMWVGNVPSDATHSELWRFFSSRPPPGSPIPNTKEEEETLESEALHLAGDQPRPDYNTVGIDSIHLISRSNCCFVNMASKRHLEHAIKVSHGVSLRPHDPRCKPLVCRVRKKEDDNKTGVGAQRGKGMHKAWVEEQDKEKGVTQGDLPASSSSALTDSPSVVTPASESDTHPKRHGSVSTNHSASTSSTTSSFLHRHFPKRYFILKSHEEDDLHLSVERGLWATQSHNEPVLDQAFRTAQSVFLIFGANKSGEFFGYAKMAGAIQEENGTPRTPFGGTDGAFLSPSGNKSSSSASRKPEPSILETPEEETGEETDPSSNLKVPALPSVLSPSGVVSNSPQPISNTTTPASPPREKINKPEVDYLNVKQPQHNTAPSPIMSEREDPGARNASSLDPSLLASLAKIDIREQGIALDQQPLSAAPAAKGEKLADDQLAAGASSRPGLNDHGVFRRDTILSPQERNARLEVLEAQGVAAGDASKAELSLKETIEQGSSRPFKIEWIRVQKLPFYRTRHLRNSFNGNREVKISRDGTEIEPEVGQQLLELFWKDPALSTAQQSSPHTRTKSITSPLLT